MSKENPGNHHHSSEDLDDLALFAQEYFSADFPNPSRVDCPPADEIERLIKTGRMPPDTLRSHLLGCSNCFNFYRTKLMARDDNEVPAESFWSFMLALVRRRSLAFAGASLLILLLVGGGWYYFRHVRQQGTIEVKHGDTQIPGSANRDQLAQRSPESSSPNSKNSVEINFDSYGLRRGDNQEAEPIAEVSGVRTRFLITLPEGSPVGGYEVSIVDAYGATVKKINSKSHDGKMLIAEIDLSNLPQRKYRLCVSRATESPNCHLITLR
jgi:hypothetical protein